MRRDRLAEGVLGLASGLVSDSFTGPAAAAICNQLQLGPMELQPAVDLMG
jgi:hypothetical protein